MQEGCQFLMHVALLLVLLEPVMKHRFQAEVEEVVVLLVQVLFLVLLWMSLVLLLHQVMLLWRLRQHLDLSLSFCLLFPIWSVFLCSCACP